MDKERAGLEYILQTSLAVGVQVHRAGGYTARTHAAMKRVAETLGAERAEPAITANLVALTVYRGGWSRTAMKSGVNAAVWAGQWWVNTRPAASSTGASLATRIGR